jgi:hypothetical protein
VQLAAAQALFLTNVDRTFNATFNVVLKTSDSLQLVCTQLRKASSTHETAVSTNEEMKK